MGTGRHLLDLTWSRSRVQADRIAAAAVPLARI
jgi:hypothetical protein